MLSFVAIDLAAVRVANGLVGRSITSSVKVKAGLIRLATW